MSPKKPTLRFRKRPKETGLASIYNRDDEFELWWGDEDIGSVGPTFDQRGQHRGNVIGYYWSVGTHEHLGIQHRNTVRAPVATLEEAKAACRAYVEECLVGKGLKKP